MVIIRRKKKKEEKPEAPTPTQPAATSTPEPPQKAIESPTVHENQENEGNSGDIEVVPSGFVYNVDLGDGNIVTVQDPAMAFLLSKICKIEAILTKLVEEENE